MMRNDTPKLLSPVFVVVLGLLAVAACGPGSISGGGDMAASAPSEGQPAAEAPTGKVAEPDGPAPAGLAKATFAGGCFWCMELPFDKLDGVRSTTSGYIGGRVDDPTYDEVSAGRTGHAEAMQVIYDPEAVSYEELLEVFWRNVDPFDDGGQFCDRGDQYRTGIFVHSDEQRTLAEASKEAVETELGRAVVTPIEEATTFYPAEDYHQDFYEKSPLRYRVYRNGCGRDRRLEQVWGDEAGGGH
jgi:peptide-methionine (S)-S-oxide reductase